MLQKNFDFYDSLVVVTVSALTNMNPPPVSLMGGRKQITYCTSCKNGHMENIRQWLLVLLGQLAWDCALNGWQNRLLVKRKSTYCSYSKKISYRMLLICTVYCTFNARKGKMKQLAVASNHSKTEKLTNIVPGTVGSLYQYFRASVWFSW